MEQVLKKLTLDFFGNCRHKISPNKFFEIENGVLLDVRSKEEAESISIAMKWHPNIKSRNITVHEIPDRLNEIPKDKPVGIFCPANIRSAITFGYLLSMGFSDVRIVDGGYPELTEALKPGPMFKALQSKK